MSPTPPISKTSILSYNQGPQNANRPYTQENKPQNLPQIIFFALLLKAYFTKFNMSPTPPSLRLQFYLINKAHFKVASYLSQEQHTKSNPLFPQNHHPARLSLDERPERSACEGPLTGPRPVGGTYSDSR